MLVRRFATVISCITLSALCVAPPAAGQSTYPYSIRTIAGSFPLGDGGPASAALLEFPLAAAADGSGNVFVADNQNRLLRKVDSRGNISTIAGYTGNVFDLQLDTPGNLYFTDGLRIYRLTTAGVLSTIAGTGESGFKGDGGPATSAAFKGIQGIALDKAGNIFVADMADNRIRKITADGIIRTIAGTGDAGFTGDGSPAVSAKLDWPTGVAVSSGGDVIIADYWNDRVRKIDGDGIISTIGGDGYWGATRDGNLAIEASIRGPFSLAFDSKGTLYISESDGARIRKILPTRIIQSAAGSGTSGFSGDDGSPLSAKLSTPTGISIDAAGNLWIADTSNHRVRKVDSGGTVITTLAGRSHFGGDNGPATAALLQRPRFAAVSAKGDVYIADSLNNRIRVIGPDGVIKTIAGTGESGMVGEGGPAVAATVVNPGPMAFDSTGNLFVADRGNYRVRKISPAGVISSVAGNSTSGYSGDGGPSTTAAFSTINGLAVDKAGNIYVGDTNNHRVRKITPDLQISTVAGTGVKGFSGDGSLATSAKLYSPYSLATDDAGNLYIEDYGNYRIRKVDAAGIISTVAGTGECCSSGDNGPALSARISTNTMAADGAGNLYLSNYSAIRKIDTSGVIRLIAGSNTAGFGGDGGPALSANLRGPYGMAVDAADNIYIADTENNRIRKLEINAPAKLEIADGDNQTGTVGQPLAKALRVRVLGSSGAGVAGVVIAFAVTAGEAKLSASAAVTDQNGMAAISATPNKAGAITVSATTGSLKVNFSIAAQAGNGGGEPVLDPDTPKISAGGIVQQGYSVPAVKQISPGGIVTIYGENFATKSFAPALAPLTDGRLPVKYAGLCVYVGGEAVPIFGFTPNQITVQIPRVASGSVGVQIRRYCGETRELRSNVETVTAQAATPEFLYLKNNSDGVNPVAVHDSITYKWIGPAGLLPGVESAPAKAGDYLTIYGVGFGDTSPALVPGQTVNGTPRLAQPAQVSIGGVNVSAADLLYIGLSPNYIGLYQLNIRVPQGIPSGNQSITLRIGANNSPAGAYLAIE